MRFLEIHELAEQRVVLGVADLGRIQLVVEPPGALDLGTQLRGARGQVSLMCHPTRIWN